MPTKGASFRYGNTNGVSHKGQPTESIGYAWAKDFSRGGLDQHFKDHGREFGAASKAEYAAKAVHFANEIDKKNYKSVTDYKKTTYKYDPRDGRIVIVAKDGYVISYHHAKNKFTYHSKEGKVITKWIKKKSK